MKTLHLHITGRVQSVGFRAWLVREASALHLDGWVRNVGTGTVEAIISGPEEAVDRCVSLCRHGPPAAMVTGISLTATTPPNEVGFVQKSSQPGNH